MNNPSPDAASKEAKDAVSVLRDYLNFPFKDAALLNVVQIAIDQSNAALQAQLDEAKAEIERITQECRVWAVEVATLRADMRDLNEYWNGNNGSAVDACTHCCEVSEAALKRTAKDYEGLVVVPKAEWDALSADGMVIDKLEWSKIVADRAAGYERIASLESDLAAQNEKGRIEYQHKCDVQHVINQSELSIPDGDLVEAVTWLVKQAEAVARLETAKLNLILDREKVASDLAAQSAKLSEAEKELTKKDRALVGAIERLEGYCNRQGKTRMAGKSFGDGSVSNPQVGQHYPAVQSAIDICRAAIAKGTP